MGVEMKLRKAIQGGAIERQLKRDLPHGPVDGYRKTTAASRKAETTYYIQRGKQ